MIGTLDVKALRALGDESRMRAVLALRQGELCVCQIVELLELAPSTVSEHLRILKEAGLVKGRKKGRWVYYRIVGSDAAGIPALALRIILAQASATRQALDDVKRLGEIFRLDPEALCERQRRC